MLDTLAAINEIAAVASSHKNVSCTVAIVGSSSPLSKEVAGAYSDVDLVIVYEDGSACVSFLEGLREAIGQSWRILKTWSVVSPPVVGGPTIHVHSVDANAYLGTSSLFRRSVAKYPSLVGQSLTVYAPATSITREELLNDRLGVLSLIARLDTQKQHSGFALEVVEPMSYSSPTDISVYCVLHSVRNTLRWLDRYEEFSRVDDLEMMWSAVRGSKPDVLNRFIGRKRARRKGRFFSQDDESISAVEARDFLSALSEWILSFRPTAGLRCE